ncbi:MAG: type II secretion system protein [Atribacterota bacterium]|jgi:type II secretory pathway pseudopilin PulG|nr:type II secretion system protein [Atribacterota bacterium]
MENKKGFTLITIVMVLAIIGLSSLIGLKYYGFNQQESPENNITKDKAKNTIVQANTLAIYNLLQGAVITEDISIVDAVNLSKKAGLYDPFTEIAMDKADWFPEKADTPGQIQIILKEDTFYIQGYGFDGLLGEAFTVEK